MKVRDIIKPTQKGRTRHIVASRRDDLERIRLALDAAASLLLRFYSAGVKAEFKSCGDPVTKADRAANQLLFEMLVRGKEGWLSEESKNDPSRLHKDRVWVVDPLDGTREFIAGISEWSISVALVEKGRAVAGGVCNPVTGDMILGSLETGIVVRSQEKGGFARKLNNKPIVLASRNEVERGEWSYLQNAPFVVRPVGSIAYRLALVAAGLADATWTFVPKHEWDIAAGAALVVSAGGLLTTLDGQSVVLNRPEPLLDGVIAMSATGQKEHGKLFEEWLTQGLKVVS